MLYTTHVFIVSIHENRWLESVKRAHDMDFYPKERKWSLVLFQFCECYFFQYRVCLTIQFLFIYIIITSITKVFAKTTF